jgi:thiol-disulfide isomerase/thioredoxin
LLLAGLLAAMLVACNSPARDAADDAFRPIAVGDSMPVYNARTLAGDSVRVGPGEPLTLVNEWATWCTSCREELGDLEHLARDYAPRGLRVLAVSVDQGTPKRVSRFVQAQGLTLTVVHDAAGRIQRLYRTVGVPSTYLVSKDGRLLWQQTGGLHGAPDAARAAIERALGG